MKKISLASLMVLVASCGDHSLKQESQLASIDVAPPEGSPETITLKYCEVKGDICDIKPIEINKENNKYSLPRFLNAGRTYRFGVEYKANNKTYKTNMEKEDANGLGLDGNIALCGYTQKTLEGINSFDINACVEDTGKTDGDIEITVKDEYYDFTLPEKTSEENKPICTYISKDGKEKNGITADAPYICRIDTRDNPESYASTLKISYFKDHQTAYRHYEGNWKKGEIPVLQWEGKANLSMNIIASTVWKDGGFDLTLDWGNEYNNKYLTSYEISCQNNLCDKNFVISQGSRKSTVFVTWQSPQKLPTIKLTPVRESFELKEGYEVVAGYSGLNLTLNPKLDKLEYNGISHHITLVQKSIIKNPEDEKPLQ